MHWSGVVAHYRSRLTVEGEPVTLLEGNTPLVPVPRVAEWACPGAELFIKYEGLNPTGSFKDRGMTAAMTQAKHDGAETVICASTGNTAASAAAYAARAGMKCIVLVPDGKIAMGKLAGSMAYGAQVVQIRGSFDDGLRMVRDVSERTPIALVNSVNPARLQGQKTAAFEIVDALGNAPDWLCLPVGNAGNISSYWLGFREALADGHAASAPRLLGGQAAGSAPLLANAAVDEPETLATAIRIGHPARWCQALWALRESAGQIWSVTDDEILATYHCLAAADGIFCEPSSAAGVAALRKSLQHGKIEVEGRRIVCVLTGHGLKDPDSALRDAKLPQAIEPTLDALMNVIE
ncbi:MAG: threonine synthase [Chthonomonas sp.]|nr:threonine synthase [Chthonomonas sp.]